MNLRLFAKNCREGETQGLNRKSLTLFQGFSIFASFALTACSTFSSPLTQSKFQSLQLGAPDGYQHLSEIVPIHTDACSLVAYLEGFKADYYQTWNFFVGTKDKHYRLLAEQQTSNSRIASNWQLYKDKQFNLSNYNDRSTEFGLQHMTSTNDETRCAAASYLLGQEEGASAAITEYKRLEAQELRLNETGVIDASDIMLSI